MVWFMVDSAAHVHPCGTYIHVHTQLPNPTWKNRGLCASELKLCSHAYSSVGITVLLLIAAKCFYCYKTCLIVAKISMFS